MSAGQMQGSVDDLTRLVAEVEKRRLALSSEQRRICIGSDLLAVDRVLSRIQREGLARGPVFCEWGSGLGGVCSVAAMNGFIACGIEIEGALVDSARSLAKDLNLSPIFAEGTFLLPGDDELSGTANSETRLTFDAQAWRSIDLAPEDCDVIFAYPWPGEESFVDEVFARHASAGALLVTFHDFDRVLAQRKQHDGRLRTLGWM